MKERQIIITKIAVLIILVSSFFSLLFLRLIDLQLLRGESLTKLADDNRFFNIKVPAERGVIVDRYGDPLVYNVRSYYQLADDTLFSEKTVVSRQEALLKKANREGTIGFDLLRRYRQPYVMSHVLGYTGPVAVENLLDDKSLEISDQVGKMSLEKKYDEELRGRSGKDIFEIDALGNKLRLWQQQLAIPGLEINTTLDPYLSQAAFEAMGEQQGAVVIADAANGEILTIISTPSFDANVFSHYLMVADQEQSRRELVQSFFDDQRQVFFNRAVKGLYPPGSIFKLVTSLAGLEEGAITTETVVNDEGILRVGDYQYTNWYYNQYGRTEGAISLVRAISRSNDIYFYKAAEWIGPDKLAVHARNFGLGQKTGLELDGEAAGLVPDPKWKEETRGERWFLGNTYHFGIGQGDVLVTPLQITQLVQAIANEGSLCRPTLLTEQSERCKDLGYRQKNIEIILKGMLGACSSGGTAFPLFSHNVRVLGDELVESNPIFSLDKGAVACKTGTSEFGGADAQGYHKTHGWLAAIVGINQHLIKSSTQTSLAQFSKEASLSASLSAVAPDLSIASYDRDNWLSKIQAGGFPSRLVVVVLVESDETNPFKEGSRDAGPVVRQIIDWIYGYTSS